MKIKRRTTLGEALEEVAAVAQRIRAGDTVEVDGRTFARTDEVLLEIELEQKNGKAELEFEIKWPSTEAGAEEEEHKDDKRSESGKGSRRRRGGGGSLLGLVAGLAAAALVSMLRRRHGREDGAR